MVRITIVVNWRYVCNIFFLIWITEKDKDVRDFIVNKALVFEEKSTRKALDWRYESKPQHGQIFTK